MEKKSCLNYGNRELGFGSRKEPDSCDYTCHIDNTWGLLLCVHGLSTKQVRQKLANMGRDCSNWIKTKARFMKLPAE